MKLYLLFVCHWVLLSSIEAKEKLTLDAFFNYTSFESLSLSPNGDHLLIHTERPAWDSNSFENNLWLYDVYEGRHNLITNQLFEPVKPQWSPTGNWIFFLQTNNFSSNTTSYRYKSTNDPKIEQNIYLYSVESKKLISIPIGTDIPLAVTWSGNDSSLYFATFYSNSSNKFQWKDVIQYRERQANEGSQIHRIDIDSRNQVSPMMVDIANVSVVIGELLFVPFEEQLIFTSVSDLVENADVFQIYSLNLHDISSLSKLTSDESVKLNLQLSTDGKSMMFQTFPSSSSEGKSNNTQQRLYSVDLSNGRIDRWGKDFNGNIVGYTTKVDGGVYILEQLGTIVQIYSQQSSMNNSILHRGLDGTYDLISASMNSIVFVFSSFEQAQEVYFIENIDQLKSAKLVTSENSQFEKFDLSKGKIYQWNSDEDNRTIEGILHYPPGHFEEKNLPLLVLIHGGPPEASLNTFVGDWYNWAPIAATEGWLVLEPNYRGSTGYGDQFLDEIRYRPLSRPGNDILSAVDRLIHDGIADPTKLAIGGYSYGGYLTNWLITQTTRFNAALSGAGAIEHVSAWGATDMPVLSDYLFGGFPWVTPQIYQSESPIYHFGKIRTPTHIVAGGNDIRVPVSQNLMLERGLHYLKVPVKLLLLPNEGHPLDNDPWHGKIKIREELKWLQIYGHNSSITTKN